jgi:hypothetical protein
VCAGRAVWLLVRLLLLWRAVLIEVLVTVARELLGACLRGALGLIGAEFAERETDRQRQTDRERERWGERTTVSQ